MTYSPQLNIRSVYNFQESLIKIDDYISFAKKHDFSYLFYLENETMYGVAEFIKKCQVANIKPIYGVSVKLKEEQFINILPINKKGYQNICLISSYLNDEKKLTDEQKIAFLNENVDKNNLVILNLNNKNLSILNLLSLKENTYDVNVHKVFSKAIRYFNQQDKKHYTGLYGLKKSISFQQAAAEYQIDESYPEDDEIENLYPNSFKILDEIAEKAFYDIFKNQSKHMGKYSVPNNMPSFQFLKQKCKVSLRSYFLNVKKTEKIDSNYLQRLNHELEVIQQTGFADYFLIVHDYVNYAKKNQIIVGPGRGSAAGSLVAFLLQITTIDPMQYGLLFERFLNPERISMPDIDIDFQDNRRDEVIEYLFEKYGRYKVATIVTYQTIAFKSAFRDACRVYEVDLNFVNMITKSVQGTYMSYEEILKSNKLIKDYSQTLEFIEVFDFTKKLMGCPRQTGTHAAGIVMADKDLRAIVPLRQGSNGIYQTQYDMNFLEEIGLIKMDLLGLRNLTILNEIISLIKKNYKKDIKLSQIPLNDQLTFEILQKGDTTGIFQLESQGMTNLIVKMQVNSIDDIASASALYRPGPQEMIPEYLSSRKTKKFELVDTKLASILNPTFGIIVYQEQVMQILQKVASFSLAKADIVRRAMGKKQIKYMDNVKQEFIKNAINNNFSLENANNIWDWIENFAKYGFNKSHAIAYSYIGYWLAWFKAHFPAEFYTSLLNGAIGNPFKTNKYIKEVKKYGINVVTPTIKHLNINYISYNKNIYMPLMLIKGVGKEFINALRNIYERHNDLFDDINSFFFYTKNKGLNESNYDLLTKSGCFDCFGYNKMTMLTNKNFIFSAITTFDTNKTLEQQNKIENLFIQENNLEIESNFEREIFGFYINANPIAKLKNEHAFFKPIDIENLVSGQNHVNIIGQVSNIRVIKDKNQNNMAFITFFDDTANLDITIFSSLFEEIGNEILIGKNYVLEVKVQKYQEKNTAVLNKIVKPIK